MPHPISIDKKIMKLIEHVPGNEIESTKFRDDLHEALDTTYSKKYLRHRLKILGIKARPKFYHNERSITWVYRDIKIKKPTE